MAAEKENYIDQLISMAIQDAVDNIRNVTTISNVASSVALSKILSGGDKTTCLLSLVESEKMIENSIDNYEKIMKISMVCRGGKHNFSNK